MKRRILFTCNICGFTVDTTCAKDKQQELRILKEHVVVASLFGCDECEEKLKKMTKEVK